MELVISILIGCAAAIGTLLVLRKLKEEVRKL